MTKQDILKEFNKGLDNFERIEKKGKHYSLKNDLINIIQKNYGKLMFILLSGTIIMDIFLKIINN